MRILTTKAAEVIVNIFLKKETSKGETNAHQKDKEDYNKDDNNRDKDKEGYNKDKNKENYSN